MVSANNIKQSKKVQDNEKEKKDDKSLQVSKKDNSDQSNVSKVKEVASKEKDGLDEFFVKQKYIMDLNMIEYYQVLYREASQLVDTRKFKKNFLNYVRMKYPKFDQEVYSQFLKYKVYKTNSNYLVIDLKFNTPKEESNKDAQDKKSQFIVKVGVEYLRINMKKFKIVEYVWKGGSDEVLSYIDEMCKEKGSKKEMKEVKENSIVTVDLLDFDGKVIEKYVDIELFDMINQNKAFLGKKNGQSVNFQFKEGNAEGVTAGMYMCKIKKIVDVQPITRAELAKSLKVKEKDLNSTVYQIILHDFATWSKTVQKMEFFNYIESNLVAVLKDKVSNELLTRQKLEIEAEMQKSQINKEVDVERYALRRAVISVFLYYYSQQYNIKMEEIEDKVILHPAVQKDSQKITLSELKNKFTSIQF